MGLRLSWKERRALFAFKLHHLWVGVSSALVLYWIFWLGKLISPLIFPSASRQISNIYITKAQLDPLTIGLLLFFVMGPAEEIYWHGFVQRLLGLRLGPTRGVFLTASIYALVHVVAFNFMLVGAAGVCGLFWGLLYQKEKSLIPVILSHSLWDVIIFVVFPLN